MKLFREKWILWHILQEVRKVHECWRNIENGRGNVKLTYGGCTTR